MYAIRSYYVPEIDWELKNAGRIDFTSTTVSDYINNTLTIGNNVYEFTNTNSAVPAETTVSATGNIAVDIASCIDSVTGEIDLVSLVSQMSSALTANADDASRFVASGTSIRNNFV